MDRAVAQAIAGKQVGDVEAQVAAAKGVDRHVEEHQAARSGDGGEIAVAPATIEERR
jgi:molecular chaperone HscA